MSNMARGSVRFRMHFLIRGAKLTVAMEAVKVVTTQLVIYRRS